MAKKTKSDEKKVPAYRIFSVTRAEGDKKASWFEIGGAWKHEDGKGLTLQFRAHALPGTDIVLREPLPAKTEDETEA